MSTLIPLTGADGRSRCGPDCGGGGGCPYSRIAERGPVALIAEAERCYPGQWLAFVIPPGEDEYDPERGVLVAHSEDDNEVWDAVARITFTQVVHVYYNGPLDRYLEWADGV